MIYLKLIEALKDKHYLGILLSFGTWLQNLLVKWVFSDYSQSMIAKVANTLSFVLVVLGIIATVIALYVRFLQVRNLKEENKLLKKKYEKE